MTGFWDLSLIRFLDFYLVLLFLASLIRRVDLYRSVVGLVWHAPNRWPRLLKLVQQHRMIFMTWPTMMPALLALGLSVTQLIASRLVWPEAGRLPEGLTVGKLVEIWPAAILAVVLFLAMTTVDIYGIVVVGKLDNQLLEQYFDQAEYWLRSKTAHVVRIVTFGFVNPREMVSLEVRKALIEVSKLLNTTLWWIALQMGLRIAFGLTLWLTWAITRLWA